MQGAVDEIRLAKSYGIDGFMVDELADTDSYRTVWLRLLKAAEIVGNFKIGLQPDFATLGTSRPPRTARPGLQRDKMKHWIDLAKDSPALLRFGGKPVVMPYGAGDPDAKHYDGKVTYPEGEKRDVVDWFAAQGEPIAYAAMHGLGWPIYASPYANDPKTGFQTFAFATATFSPGDNVDTMADDVNIRQGPPRAQGQHPAARAGLLAQKLHAGRRSLLHVREPRPALVHRAAPEHALARRLGVERGAPGPHPVGRADHLERLGRVRHRAVHQDLHGACSRSRATTPTGSRPASAPKITQDVVTIFHREAPIAAAPTKYPNRVGGPVPSDEVEALAMLTAPSTLVLKSGDKEYRQAVGAGVQSLIKPFALGVQSARIERHGVVVASITSPHAHPRQARCGTTCG